VTSRGITNEVYYVAQKVMRYLGSSSVDSRILLQSDVGEYQARAFVADVAEGTLQGHWPEVNGLIPSGIVDPDGGVPGYNARVRLVVCP